MLDCFNDLVADFRVFYRVDSAQAMGEMDVEEFFVLANRCVAYEGAVRWKFDLDMYRRQREIERLAQPPLPSRIAESGGEVSEVLITDSYLYDLLRDEEMAHG